MLPFPAPLLHGPHGDPNGGDKLVTFAEAWVACVLSQAERVCLSLDDALGYVEAMLRQQLTSAIGHEVGGEAQACPPENPNAHFPQVLGSSFFLGGGKEGSFGKTSFLTL